MDRFDGSFGTHCFDVYPNPIIQEFMTTQTIILTGASTGIGRALAIQLAAKGASLVLAARNPVTLQETTAACNQVGGDAIAVPTDVAQPDACQRLVEAAVEAFGRVDVLVNNAGISAIAPFEKIEDLSLFEQVMRVNYLGAVYCTHYALPHLQTSRGLLVAISSQCGKIGVPTRSGYVASKHAMQGFFDTLRIEQRPHGVAVLVVSPGFVATDIRKRALGGDGCPIGVSHRDESRQTMPVEECARQIVRAMEQRQRELLMTFKGKVAPWMKLIAPGLLDRITAAAIGS